MSTSEISKPKPPTLIQTIGGDQFKQQIAMALPRHLTPDRFTRIAITAMRRVPKLLQCTPESVLGCLMQLSQYGLEPDGRRAHLIPYGTECTLILDYKGIAELALRSGLVSTLHADVVHRGDIFRYSLGKVIEHTPWFLRDDKDRPEKEGEIFAVYAHCENKDDTSCSAVLSIDEVESVRKRSKAGRNGPWVTDWNEMAKKTAFRRLSKWLVLSPEFRDAVAHDEEVESIETTATEKAAIRISDLVLDTEATSQSEQSEPVSQMEAIREWIESQPGLETGAKNADGTVRFVILPTKPGAALETLLISDVGKIETVNGEQLVLATDADALDQVKAIVDRAAKHAAR